MSDLLSMLGSLYSPRHLQTLTSGMKSGLTSVITLSSMLPLVIIFSSCTEEHQPPKREVDATVVSDVGAAGDQMRDPMSDQGMLDQRPPDPPLDMRPVSDQGSEMNLDREVLDPIDMEPSDQEVTDMEVADMELDPDMTPDDSGQEPSPEGAYVETDFAEQWPRRIRTLADGATWNPIRTIYNERGEAVLLRARAPLQKPFKTRYDPAIHEDRQIEIIFRESVQARWHATRFVSDADVDTSALDRALLPFAEYLGAARPTFSGERAELETERVSLELEKGRALRDRSAYFIQSVTPGAPIDEICDAYNQSPLVEFAGPITRLVSTSVSYSRVGDLGRPTEDFTPFQHYLPESSPGASGIGGFGMCLPWSMEGGRGGAVSGGQIEGPWNVSHEDINWSEVTIASPRSSLLVNQDPDTSHSMAVLGIVKATNNGYGVTGLASEADLTLLSNKTDRLNDQLERLADILEPGSVVFISLGNGGPNRRSCTSNTDCAPRVACLPAPPYKLRETSPVEIEMRCEGYHATDFDNSCASDQDCYAQYGFGARCLPLSLFPTYVRSWKCGGDPNAASCSTSSDCVPVSECATRSIFDFGTKYCGGFEPTWPAGAPWIPVDTRRAGDICTANNECPTVANATCHPSSRCQHRNSTVFMTSLDYQHSTHLALDYLTARGVIVFISAGNGSQRLGLLSEETYQPPGGIADVSVGHDTYKRFYDCPFSGCDGPVEAIKVAATVAGTQQTAWFSNRGPGIGFKGWGSGVTTLGTNSQMLFRDAIPPRLGMYGGGFNGTSSAAPLIAGLALSLQSIARTLGGDLMTRQELIDALSHNAAFGNIIDPTDPEYVAGKPRMREALAWMESAGIIPLGSSLLTPPELEVTSLGAFWEEGDHSAEIKLNLHFKIHNRGEEINPPLGLRVNLGEAGATWSPPQSADLPGTRDVLLWTAIDANNPIDACRGAGIQAGCKDHDDQLKRRRVFVPMINGVSEEEPQGGSRTFYYQVSLPRGELFGYTDPEVCVMLDRSAQVGYTSLINPGGAPPDWHACAPVKMQLPEILNTTGEVNLRALTFNPDDPEVNFCGNGSIFGHAGPMMEDLVVSTHRRNLAFMAFPHSGSVGVYDLAACDEIDFDPDDADPSCAAGGTTTRIEMVPRLPGSTNQCAPEVLASKRGHNPSGLAITRDQRFVAVVMRNLGDECAVGKLSLIDLRDPAQPKLFKRPDAMGVPQVVEIDVGINPVDVEVTRDSTLNTKILVLNRSAGPTCGRASGVSEVSLSEVLNVGEAASVTYHPWLFACPGATCALAAPTELEINDESTAIFTTDEDQGYLGMMRLSDFTTFIFSRNDRGDTWDRPKGLDVIDLPEDGWVRAAFGGTTFLGLDRDPAGNTCPPQRLCGGLHWVDVHVPTGTTAPINSGRLIPLFTPLDVAIAPDLSMVLVSSSTKHLVVETPDWGSNMVVQPALNIGGGRRFAPFPEVDETCPDEQCNGIDDDCNGVVDDPWVADLETACEVGLGVCSHTGVLQCNEAGTAVECSVEPHPGLDIELCNGEDDDCDGAFDEDWPELGSGCHAGLGPCRRVGEYVCTPDELWIECSARSGAPDLEVCNGEDDDCDGEFDEELECDPEPEPEPPPLVCEGPGCDDLQTCNVTSPLDDQCPVECTGGCLNDLCLIHCLDAGSCQQEINCPLDRPCRVVCRGRDSCIQTSIRCGDGLSCSLVCSGEGACEGTEVVCGSGLCEALCEPGSGQLTGQDCTRACACQSSCRE